MVTSSYSASGNLVLIDARSGAITQLTEGEHRDCHPQWSPEGQRIAFSSNRTGQYEIYVIERDGTGLMQVTHGDGDKDDPAWSPDGRRLAFASHIKGDEIHRALNVVDLETQQVTTIIELRYPTEDAYRNITSIDWSPTDANLMLVVAEGGLDLEQPHSFPKLGNSLGSRAYILDLETETASLVTPEGWECILPLWSPSGMTVLQNCCSRLTSQDGSCAPIVGKLTDTETGFALEELRELAGITGSLVYWSPDGVFWVATSWTNSGLGSFEIHEIQPYMTHPSYSSDGMVATGLYLWPTPLIEDDTLSLSEPDWGP